MLTGTRQNQIYNDRVFPDTDLEAVDLDDHLCVATSVCVYQSPSTALNSTPHGSMDAEVATSYCAPNKANVI